MAGLRQQDGPLVGNLTDRTARRLWFQVAALFVIVAMGYCVSVFKPRQQETFTHMLSDEVVPAPSLSFEEAVMGRKLQTDQATGEDCSGQCEGRDETLEKDKLNSDFLMIKGSVMLKYRNECDDIQLPTDDDSDDEDCILELGEGRRRQTREQARANLTSHASAATGFDSSCNGVLIQDDYFTRDKTTLKCSMSSSKKAVCVKAGEAKAISSTSLATIRKEKMIWIIWYIFGIVYMMAALAIVCDEFFVPALECFVDAFGISMDVAGATFMAAGGSMPELFTSFIATFQESEVGFVAIVGSAVFNVLFVIAVCAIASTEVLTLTWWPLFRDCCFYVIALLSVALVFNISSKNKIEAWEACLLLSEYIMYCTFMKFNGKVYSFIEKKLHVKKVVPVDGEGASTRISNITSETNINFTKPGMFRQGIVKMLTKNAFLYETAGVAAVTNIKGELEDTFKRLDNDNDGKINIKEVTDLLKSLGVEPDTPAIKTSIRRINRSGDDEIDFESFRKWYLASEARIQVEFNNIFDKLDTNKDGFIEAEEVKVMLKELGHKPTDEDVAQIMADLLKAEDGGDPKQKATFDQFEDWYNASMFYEGKKKACEAAAEEDEGDDGGLSLEMPEGASYSALFWYFFTYPLCALLYSTLPDVRVEKWQRNAKMAICEFALSLIWIGIFSNWLYECLVVVSNTFRIPVAVSAVTLLAGGTSVPDLLSSYVVARNGEGDMAVSSSIGSNIFDVTVGLPLPWLSYIIIKGKDFELGPNGSKGLGFSIILLVMMLAAVIGTIMIMRWRLTKCLGYVMLVFYIMYVVQYLLQKLPPNCNANEVGVFQIDF